MKILLALIVLLIVPSMARCQSSETEEEHIIARMLAPGIYEGGYAKVLDKMGDAAAVVTIKLLGESKLGPNNVENILAVIHLSFSAPVLVETPVDRKPRATLFLLRSLDSVVLDQKLKQRIGEERKFVLDQFAKSIKDETR